MVGGLKLSLSLISHRCERGSTDPMEGKVAGQSQWVATTFDHHERWLVSWITDLANRWAAGGVCGLHGRENAGEAYDA